MYLFGLQQNTMFIDQKVSHYLFPMLYLYFKQLYRFVKYYFMFKMLTDQYDN